MFILKVVKVVCFDTLLEVFILKDLRCTGLVQNCGVLGWSIQRVGRPAAGGFQRSGLAPGPIGAGGVDAVHSNRIAVDSGHPNPVGVNSEAAARRTAMWGRRKSGGKPPHSLGEDGLGLANHIIAHKLTPVKDNLLVIRMDVAI